MKKIAFTTKYITELRHKSFHTTITLGAENISKNIQSVLKYEREHNVSMMIINSSTDDGNTSTLQQGTHHV